MKQYLDEDFDKRSHGGMKWRLAHEEEIPLWVADMDFKAPQAVVKALGERVASAFFPYTYAWASIREAFAAWTREHQGWDAMQGDFLLAPSLLTALMAALQAYTNPGDGVIIQAPVYGPFFSIPRRLGRHLIVNQLVLGKAEDKRSLKYTMDFENLEAHCKAGAKALVLCSPHNPVGRVWTHEELQTLGFICKKYDLWLIVDEIHADMIAPDHSFVAAAQMIEESFFDPERTLVLQAPSKTFNIPGIGCGLAWSKATAPVSALRACLSDLSMGSVNILAMNACENAYKYGLEWFTTVKELVDLNSKTLSAHQIKHWPAIQVIAREGSFLSWIDCSKRMQELGMDDEQFNKHIRQVAKVYLSPGKAFGTGGEGFVRLNLGCRHSNLLEALSRLDKVFV